MVDGAGWINGYKYCLRAYLMWTILETHRQTQLQTSKKDRHKKMRENKSINTQKSSFIRCKFFVKHEGFQCK